MEYILTIDKKIKNVFAKYNTLIFMVAAVILAIAARLYMFDCETSDYTDFLKPWWDFIKSHGGFRALKYNFSNYSVPYLYILALLTYTNIPCLYAIKIVSVFFDFTAALIVYHIVKLKYKESMLAPLSFCTVLFAPTVLINGALWGQCDSIYTTWLLASILSFMKNKKLPAFIFYSLAFAFKLQAIFLFPILVILYFKKDFSIFYFLTIPGIYLLLSLPAVAVGRPLWDILMVYFNQVGTYEFLTLNAPNLYQWIPNDYYDFINPAGQILAVMAVVLFFFAVYKSHRDIDNEILLKLSLLSVLIVPYFLPQMHERYFFPADIISIPYAFYFYRKYFYVPITIILISFFSYGPYLSGEAAIQMTLLALVLLILIIILLVDLLKSLYPKTDLPS